ncbi:FliM/FliN family flagellar motor switch protein [Hyphomicrobium sp.]|uniref:FliM/FliN family flagellar motor switch protein n=1 Tax=Hyphomicrobium sp. TaxID=82 RepID=UPI002B6A98EB|nr:FliM/FliN family flagellar motor switch protein [Hyphomicrobium sp.]HVZ04372.1 FliM/FliN family flagellar motor switch protein [Hyphomicrobium sp.]
MTAEASKELPISQKKALERALSAGHNRPDRLPGLQMIFNQLPRVMVEEIGNLSSLPLRVHLLELSATTLGEACALPQDSLAAAVRAERWRSWLYFIADRMTTMLFVEAASGCESFPAEGFSTRKLTKTDANLVHVLFRRLARSLTSAFSLLVDIPLDVGETVDKIELEPQLSATSPVITARLTLEYPSYAGTVTVVIPQAAIEPIRDLLAGASATDNGTSNASPSHEDPTWSRQLADEIARAFIDLTGVLEERPIALGEVQRFAVGSVVELQSTSLSRVRLDSDEIPLFWCELGKRGAALTLRVEDDFDGSRDAIDEFYGL